MTHDVGQFGGCAAGDQAGDLGARHIDIGQHARVFRRGQRHSCRRGIKVQRLRDDEAIQRVKIRRRHAIHLRDAPAVQREARLRVIGAVGHDQAGFGPGLDVGLFVDIAL